MRKGLSIIGFCALLLSFDDVRSQDVLVNSSLIYSTDNHQIVTATADSLFTIKEILVSGDKRTRRSTVIRELSFHAGDSYPFSEFIKKMEQSKRQLMNTNLFRNVIINLRTLPDRQVSISVDLEEKWYFLPQPFIRIANGTFSQWNERGRKLDHLNYGIKLTQLNFSGRGDRAHLHLAKGYTKKIAVQYQGFYFDKDLKWSGNVNLAHGKNREINYTTEYNKLLAVKNPDGFLYQFYQASFDLVYRPAIKTRHQFTVGYNYNRIADTVRKLNENFSPAENVYAYPYLSYGVSFTDYDFNAYPTRGRYGDASIHRAGIGSSLNLWQLSARGVNYWGLGKKAYFSIRLGGTIKLPFKQPYITQGFLGHGDAYLQGYENYIIDGVAGVYTKQTVGFNIINTAMPLPNNKWFKSLRSIPFRAYVKAYTNAGYSHNPNTSFNNALNNKMLYSTGVGLDIIIFTDTIFKI